MGSEPVVSVHPNAGELYAELIGSLVEVVSDPSPDADEVRSVLRKTIQRICLEPRKNESGYNLVIKGDLAALISQDGQTTLMMGAGAGFEPATFRL